MFSLRDAASRFKTVRNLFITTCICLLLYVYTPILTPILPSNRLDIVLLFSILFIPVFIWRNLYILTISRKTFYKHLLYVGKNEDALNDLYSKVNLYANDNTFVGYVSDNPIGLHEEFLDLKNVNFDEIIKKNNVKQLVVCFKDFSKESIDILNNKLAEVFEHGISIVNYEDYLEEITECVPEENLTTHFYKYFDFSKNHQNRLYLFILRLLDIVAGVIGLITLLIILPFIFVLNLLGNKGPLFYEQERVGHKGELFNILKLRSMVSDAEKNGPQWAVKNDLRITVFGKFLRKTRLDEIPQFWNILKGEMSLIGPRPERPEFVKELQKDIPLFGIRNVIKPGLTGWSQVMYPYASTIEEQKTKLRYDLYYIKKRSLYIDFKILIKTITTVLYFRGQ